MKRRQAMAENNLNNLPQEEAEAPASTPEEKTVEETPEEKRIDESPDPAALQAEIEALEQRRKKAEEDAIYWRKQKVEARADFFKGRDEQPPQQTAPPPGVGQEPRASDFEDYDKYVGALTDYRVKVARAEWERDQNRREQERNAQERHQSLQAKLQEGFQKYADFEEVAFDRSATHITPMIVDILADCDHPADLAYYLAKNRVEGVAISRMTPTRAAREIAKIEAKLSSQPATPPPQRKTTSAPPPIKPIGASSTAGVQKDPDKMSMAEYEQWRLSQGARRF
jgi:hypothetical protein